MLGAKRRFVNSGRASVQDLHAAREGSMKRGARRSADGGMMKIRIEHHRSGVQVPDRPEETTREKSQAACFLVVTAPNSRSKERAGCTCLDATLGPGTPSIDRWRTSVTRPIVVDVGRPFCGSRSSLAVVVGWSHLMESSRFVLDSGKRPAGVWTGAYRAKST
jgi:hypothetical protein